MSEVTDALRVIIYDSKIRKFLEAKDPKALEQADKAVFNASLNESNIDRDGHKHEVMNVDGETREKLRSLLMEPDTPRGMGYTAFIEWALTLARLSKTPCEDSGDIFCYVHSGFFNTEDGMTACDSFDLIQLDRGGGS